MRCWVFILLFLFAENLFSQTVFNSYFTESYPSIFTSQTDNINRRITFGSNLITIATKIEGGKEIEVLTVQEVRSREGTLTFICTSSNGRKVTIDLPEQEQVNKINYYTREPGMKEEYQLTFYVKQIY
ncbi:hypothetical protein RM545_13810 [Zunongwangia sp. F260]|uniref:DUF3244 domain-containing protein n=1 Tax=Autumnicola lenta TaxID=3075593 RepID=A0ABU3CN70_9FLAO|nr:hypothetical protein [Zunongwangia sp. F260]MDT0647771.1 hypothetical protein [Zunongwangia sp. F260]